MPDMRVLPERSIHLDRRLEKPGGIKPGIRLLYHAINRIGLPRRRRWIEPRLQDIWFPLGLQILPELEVGVGILPGKPGNLGSGPLPVWINIGKGRILDNTGIVLTKDVPGATFGIIHFYPIVLPLRKVPKGRNVVLGGHVRRAGIAEKTGRRLLLAPAAPQLMPLL